LASPEFELHLGSMAGRIRVTELVDFSVANIRTEVPRDAAVPTVFVEADTWLVPLILRTPRWPGRTSLVIMRSGATSPGWRGMGIFMAKRLARLAARNLTDHRPYELTSQSDTPLNKWEIRDPVEFEADHSLTEAYRHQWSLQAPGAKYWVGVLGAIGGRKNVDVVASAISGLGDEFGLVVAGVAEREESEVQTWLRPLSNTGLSVREARLLSDVELDSMLLALDAIVLAHSNEGPSGIFAKAVAAGVPVVTAGAESLRSDSSRFPDLAEHVSLDPMSIGDGISRAVRRKPRGRGTPRGAEQFAGKLVQP
jgi:hypothetical protein